MDNQEFDYTNDEKNEHRQNMEDFLSDQGPPIEIPSETIVQIDLQEGIQQTEIMDHGNFMSPTQDDNASKASDDLINSLEAENDENGPIVKTENVEEVNSADPTEIVEEENENDEETLNDSTDSVNESMSSEQDGSGTPIQETSEKEDSKKSLDSVEEQTVPDSIQINETKVMTPEPTLLDEFNHDADIDSDSAEELHHSPDLTEKKSAEEVTTEQLLNMINQLSANAKTGAPQVPMQGEGTNFVKELGNQAGNLGSGVLSALAASANLAAAGKNYLAEKINGANNLGNNESGIAQNIEPEFSPNYASVKEFNVNEMETALANVNVLSEAMGTTIENLKCTEYGELVEQVNAIGIENMPDDTPEKLLELKDSAEVREMISGFNALNENYGINIDELIMQLETMDEPDQAIFEGLSEQLKNLSEGIQNLNLPEIDTQALEEAAKQISEILEKLFTKNSSSPSV